MFNLSDKVKVKDESWVNPAIRGKEGVFDGFAGSNVIVNIDEHYWNVDPSCLETPKPTEAVDVGT